MGRDTFVSPYPIDVLGDVLGGPKATQDMDIRRELAWDYQQLGSNANTAIEHTVAIKKSERRASEAIIEAGKHLSAMQQMLQHGQWLDWLQVEFAMSKSTAYKMMEVAERFGDKLPIIGSLQPTVLYMIAGDNIPEPAREAVIEQAANGKVTVEVAKRIIDSHKPAAVFSPDHPIHRIENGSFNTAPTPAQPAPVVVREHVRQTRVVTLPTPLSRVAIINADSRGLASMGLEPVHLVVTSPPYNVGIEYDQYDDNSHDYIPLLMDVWRACYDVMVDGARIAVVVPFALGGTPYMPFDHQIMQTLMDAGLTLRARIIWDKNTTGNRTSWGSYRLPTSPRIRNTTECIIIAHKGSDTLEVPEEHKGVDDKGTHTCWLQDGDYFMELAQDHWVVAPESAQRIGHPAPFPVELVTRLIHFYGFPGAHILDPFGGSGTVGVAAKELGCDATLVEVSSNYCQIAEERING